MAKPAARTARLERRARRETDRAARVSSPQHTDHQLLLKQRFPDAPRAVVLGLLQHEPAAPTEQLVCGREERPPRGGREQIQHVGDEHRVELARPLGRQRLDRAGAELDVRESAHRSARPVDLAFVRVDSDHMPPRRAYGEQRDKNAVTAADVEQARALGPRRKGLERRGREPAAHE